MLAMLKVYTDFKKVINSHGSKSFSGLLNAKAFTPAQEVFEPLKTGCVF